MIKLSDYACTTGKKSKSILVESPTNDEDLSFFFTDVGMRIIKIRPILVGSTIPSVTWTLRHDIDRSAVGTEVIIDGTVTTEVTTGIDVTIFDDATIEANSHVWFETTDQSGLVGSINLTIFYE